MSLPSDYNLLAQHPNKHYIECGLWRGDSMQMAVDAQCFENYFGVDIDKSCVDFCFDRFDLANSDLPLILWCNTSVNFLTSVLKLCPDPATIFLDSHWQLTGDKPDNAFPLMKELQVIMESGRENDTIIIDDVLYMTHPDITGWKLKDLYQALKRINHNYQFQLVGNPIINNLLIAKP